MTTNTLREEWNNYLKNNAGEQTTEDWWIAKMEQVLQEKVEDVNKLKTGDTITVWSAGYNQAIEDAIAIIKGKE